MSASTERRSSWPPEARADGRQSVVEADDAAGERHQLRCHGTLLGQTIEQPVLVEAAHHDQPVHGMIRRASPTAPRCRWPSDRRRTGATPRCASRAPALLVDLDFPRRTWPCAASPSRNPCRGTYGALQLVGRRTRQETTGAHVRVDACRAGCQARRSRRVAPMIPDDRAMDRASCDRSGRGEAHHPQQIDVKHDLGSGKAISTNSMLSLTGGVH